uniref:Uncharacterized protein n=1 Tax=Oryza brachyantha TaxID=4533 RepID=J3N8I3_ORYBR
ATKDVSCGPSTTATGAEVVSSIRTTEERHQHQRYVSNVVPIGGSDSSLKSTATRKPNSVLSQLATHIYSF